MKSKFLIGLILVSLVFVFLIFYLGQKTELAESRIIDCDDEYSFLTGKRGGIEYYFGCDGVKFVPEDYPIYPGSKLDSVRFPPGVQSNPNDKCIHISFELTNVSKNIEEINNQIYFIFKEKGWEITKKTEGYLGLEKEIYIADYDYSKPEGKYGYITLFLGSTNESSQEISGNYCVKSTV